MRNRWKHHDRGVSSVWGGAIILAIGVVLLLDRLGIVYARDVFQFWPMLLVAAGLTWLSRATSLVGRMIGGLTVAGGLLLQADNLGYLRLRGEIFWPFALIGIGVLLLVRALEERTRTPDEISAGGTPYWEGRIRDFMGKLNGGSADATVIFSHVERHITAQDFESIKVESVFGGVELDLREAGMKGDEAYVEANAVFGGIEIRVPESWQVIARGAAVFGGFTDQTTRPDPNTGTSAKRLIVKGSAVFGGVIITNGSRRWRGRGRYR